MMKMLLTCAVLTALCALPASAWELREYTSLTEGATGSPGLEYVVTGRDGSQVTVIEGQPRWTDYRYTSVQDPRAMFAPASQTLHDLFE
jgi:hypothetical protein